MNSCAARTWKFQFYFDKIKSILVSMKLSFYHVSRSTYGMANCLAKHVFDREMIFVASLL